MKETIKFGKNIVEELRELATTKEPDFSSDKGDLFISETIPASIIKLKVPLEKYLTFIDLLDRSERPKMFHLIPSEDDPSQIIVNAPVKLEDGAIFIDGKKVSIL